MRIIIELDISTDPEPDTGISVPDTDEATVKAAVYSYVQELIEDDSLAYRVED